MLHLRHFQWNEKLSHRRKILSNHISNQGLVLKTFKAFTEWAKELGSFYVGTDGVDTDHLHLSNFVVLYLRVNFTVCKILKLNQDVEGGGWEEKDRVQVNADKGVCLWHTRVSWPCGEKVERRGAGPSNQETSMPLLPGGIDKNCI